MSQANKVEAPVQAIAGYVPLYRVDAVTPAWAVEAVNNLHGSGKHIGDQIAVLVVAEVRGGSIPPGRWIVVYEYNDDEGCHSHELYVAAKVV